MWNIAIIIILILIVLYLYIIRSERFWNMSRLMRTHSPRLLYSTSRSEGFNIPKPVTSEYIPQNMSPSEFKEINKWDYPGYLKP